MLEARPYRPFKSSEEYLEAMKEDLAEWLSTLYPELSINAENFMDRLDTGVALCKVSGKNIWGNLLALLYLLRWHACAPKGVLVWFLWPTAVSFTLSALRKPNGKSSGTHFRQMLQLEVVLAPPWPGFLLLYACKSIKQIHTCLLDWGWVAISSLRDGRLD